MIKFLKWLFRIKKAETISVGWLKENEVSEQKKGIDQSCIKWPISKEQNEFYNEF